MSNPQTLTETISVDNIHNHCIRLRDNNGQCLTLKEIIGS